MRSFAIALLAAALLAGCTAAIEYRPFVGDAQIYQGAGGACDIADGIEIWVKGAPPKPYAIVGYIDGKYLDDIGEESALRRLIAQKVREVGGHGVILSARSAAPGDTYFLSGMWFSETNFYEEYVVFRYEPQASAFEPAAAGAPSPEPSAFPLQNE